MRALIPEALVGALLSVAAVPAAAQNWDICADLWLTRGLIQARAGGCFVETDAVALFGNADCHSSAPEFSTQDARKLEIIAAREAELGCGDNDLLALRTMRLDLRFRLDEIPVPKVRPRGCLYWTGDPVYLSTGPEPGSADLGAAQHGDDIFWEHDLPEMPAGWTFVSAYLDGQLLSLGWAEAPIDTSSCGTIVD